MKMNDLPDQFLYARKGPWPQPSPSHPLICADEVLNIPPMEELLFNETIGARYLKARVGYPAYAAQYAASMAGWRGVTAERFNQIMTETLFTRFRVEMQDEELEACRAAFAKDDDGPELGKALETGTWTKYDFSAMKKIVPLDGMHVAPTKVYFEEDATGRNLCRVIEVDGLLVRDTDSSFGIAMVYALQGASYHVLFVVHPALHFPMNSVNAITKTALPMNHPIFQMFLPHSAYSLALDNAVLESAESVVNNNAQGTRFDPLTGNAYNLKLLFGAGYAGLTEREGYDPRAYPRYNYMKPQMADSEHPLFHSFYGTWLARYYEEAFLPFCKIVADYIKDSANDPMMEYTRLWAKYLHTHVHGFPNADQIGEGDTLAKVMAIYMWNASVSHGGDHWSFSNQITAVEKCLRIRRPPPKTRTEAEVDNAKERIFSPNDMQRAALCQYMFFQAWAIEPNLFETRYALPDYGLQQAAKAFTENLSAVNAGLLQRVAPSTSPDGPSAVTNCQPLHPIMDGDTTIVPYERTIPQSIQY
ncbi:hypothetical protein CLG85_006980 [Yangia mangrovi]|uniref:Lipoxygenase n=1 Tax=Alloyangia mangrovi TaxID=1779329 RepID=A0A2A3JXD0_9RHOB|nr:hypothetical protein [Alloyangia mangrovi]MCT4370091.1 hypothetical protein [Alloyangia mangrovi]